MRRLLVVVGLVAVMGCAGCATPFTVSWEYASEQPEFALLEPCFRDQLAKAKTTGSADIRNAIDRRQAKAMRRLLANRRSRRHADGPGLSTGGVPRGIGNHGVTFGGYRYACGSYRVVRLAHVHYFPSHALQ